MLSLEERTINIFESALEEVKALPTQKEVEVEEQLEKFSVFEYDVMSKAIEIKALIEDLGVKITENCRNASDDYEEDIVVGAGLLSHKYNDEFLSFFKVDDDKLLHLF